MLSRSHTENLIEKYLGETIYSVCKSYVDTIEPMEFNERGFLNISEGAEYWIRHECRKEIDKILNSHGSDLPYVDKSNPLHAIMQEIYDEFISDDFQSGLRDFIKYTIHELMAEVSESHREKLGAVKCI